MYTYEIYLTKKYITKEEWLEFIKIISNFVGAFKNWQIIVVNNQNKLQYFTITDRILPPTINKLDAFLLKRVVKRFTKIYASIRKKGMLKILVNISFWLIKPSVIF